MNFVDADFFDNKIAIGVNRVNQKFSCKYIVAKDARGFEEIHRFRKCAKIILSKHESGNTDRPLNRVEHEYWIFDHPSKLSDEHPDVSVIGSDRIVVSYSTITSAIHIAAYMGASTIFVCGHDCGAIDGVNSLNSYYHQVQSHQGTEGKYFEWLGQIEDQTLAVVNELRSRFGVRVYSLNPFINLNLEGHSFESAVRLDGIGELSESILRSKLDWSEAALDRRNQQLHSLESSLSYRLGRAITWPLRWLNAERSA